MSGGHWDPEGAQPPPDQQGRGQSDPDQAGWGQPGPNQPGAPASGWGGQAPPPPGHPGAAPPYPGYPYPMGYGYPVQRPTNTQATWALVLGILSLTMCWFLTGIPAIILGHKARKEIARSGGTQDGDGFALAGLIMGWASTVISTLIVGFYVVIIALAVTLGESSEERFQPVGSEIDSGVYDDYCNDDDQYTYNDC